MGGCGFHFPHLFSIPIVIYSNLDDVLKHRTQIQGIPMETTPKVAQNEPKITKPQKTTPKSETAKSENSEYTYTYLLSTAKQREAIDLTKHKAKLSKIITGYFGDRLISLSFDKESYTLQLKEPYEVADKRRLGRLISQGSDLHKHVFKVQYNNGESSSGQLFVLKKIKS